MGLVLKTIKAETMITKNFSMQRITIIAMFFLLGNTLANMAGAMRASLYFSIASAIIGFLLTVPDPVFPNRMLIIGMFKAIKFTFVKKKYEPITTREYINSVQKGGEIIVEKGDINE